LEFADYQNSHHLEERMESKRKGEMWVDDKLVLTWVGNPPPMVKRMQGLRGVSIRTFWEEGRPEFGTAPHKLVRPADPDTSHQSALHVDSASLEGRVYEVIKSYGAEGCISDEVRSRMPDLPYSSITARYSALIEKGLIYDTGRRRQGESGRLMRVVIADVHARLAPGEPDPRD
jgi:hypothetical protein